MVQCAVDQLRPGILKTSFTYLRRLIPFFDQKGRYDQNDRGVFFSTLIPFNRWATWASTRDPLNDLPKRMGLGRFYALGARHYFIRTH